MLREWRLEEILGAGGFGIVYRGRGAYFDETVAIKEYFPSAISDRVEGETVKPTDSSSEEIYDLGLQKFLEEAKVLWALSKPERHPNIVSVRSLFEINGTAYMVMDFETGMSLSQMLRDGRRFDEKSLLAILVPIAEGLDRAHRAGVVHRDIKPANILVDDSARPVLIDFGSARFDAGQATSTKVTFYTPPYAALEQYVKTYPQGPWTDIYAMGVVAYQCITGEKPPEVLERLHGGEGQALANQEWPGFSRRFLRAVDAAMGIRPSERPQSVSDWFRLLVADDDVPPPPEDMTQVTVRSAPAPTPAPPVVEPAQSMASIVADAPRRPPSVVNVGKAPPAKRAPLGLVAAGVGVLAIAGGAAVMLGGKHPAPIIVTPAPAPVSAPAAAPAAASAPAAPAAAVAAPVAAQPAGPPFDTLSQTLVSAARQAGQPSSDIAALSARAAKIAALSSQLHALPAGAANAQDLGAQIGDAAAQMAKTEAADLSRSAQSQSRVALNILGKTSLPAARNALFAVSAARAKLSAAAARIGQAGDPAAALKEAANATGAYADFAAAYKAASGFFVPARQAEFTTLASSTKAMSTIILSMAAKPKPWILAPKAQKEAYQTLQDNAAQARTQEAQLTALGQAATSASDLPSIESAIERARAVNKAVTDLYASSYAVNAVK